MLSCSVDDEWFGDGLGSARVFVRSTSGNDWAQEDILIANDGKNGQYYGYSVSIHDDTALVGAFSIPDYMANAFVFVRNAGEWTQVSHVSLQNVYDDGVCRRLNYSKPSNKLVRRFSKKCFSLTKTSLKMGRCHRSL